MDSIGVPWAYEIHDGHRPNVLVLFCCSVFMAAGCQGPQQVAILKLKGLSGHACMALDGDVFVGLNDGRIVRYDPQLKVIRTEFRRFYRYHDPMGAKYITVSGDGAKLAVARAGGSIDLVDLAAPMLIAQIRVEDCELRMGVFSPDSTQLAAYAASEYVKETRSWKGPRGGNLFIYSAEDGKLLSQENTPVAEGLGQVMDWKEDVIAMADVYDEGRGRVLLWDVRRHAKLHVLVHPKWRGAPVSVALSRDAKTVAVGYSPFDLAIWDVATGRLHSLVGENDWIMASLDFSPDGRLLASGEGYSTVRVWDVATGKQLYRLPMGSQDSQNYTYSVHFDSTGQHLVCGRDDDCVVVWRLPARQ